jgi:hypothetical protein
VKLIASPCGCHRLCDAWHVKVDAAHPLAGGDLANVRPSIARLIEAAPRLLRALDDLTTALDDMGYDVGYTPSGFEEACALLNELEEHGVSPEEETT